MPVVETDTFDATAAVDNYLTVPGEPKQRPASAMRSAVTSSLDDNPDTIAELRAVSKRTGVPLGSLRNPENKKRAERQDALSNFNFDSYTQTFPHSAQFLADPDIASIAHDDIDNLGAIESTLIRLKRSTVLGGGYDLRAGAFGAMSAISGNISENFTGPIDEFISSFRGYTPGGIDQFDDLQRYFQNEFEKYQTLGSNEFAPVVEGRGFVESSIYSGIRSLGLNTPGILASVLTRSPNLALSAMTATSFGTSAGRGMQEGLTATEATRFGAKDAVVENLTERIPLFRLFKDLDAGTGVLKAVLTNVALEVPGELLATTLQNFNEWITLNADQPISTYTDQLPEDLAATVIATIAAAGAQSGAVTLSMKAVDKTFNRTKEAGNAMLDAQTLEQLKEVSTASKVIARDPLSVEGWVQSIVGEQDVTDIYVGQDELAQSGIDPQQLAQISPSFAKQVGTVEETGGMYKIPLEEFVTTIAPTEFAQSIIDVARTSPHAMNRLEAEEFMQNGLEELKNNVEQELTTTEQLTAQRQSRLNVEQNLFEQLQQAKRFTEDVNRPYAALVGNTYEALGQRLGITAEELFNQHPLNIQAQSVGGEVLSQDVVKTESDAFKEWFSDSKVVDENGDPQVMYHGTPSEIEAFNKDFIGKTTGNSFLGKGFYFTSTPELASKYAGVRAGANVMPVYLSAKNIYESIDKLSPDQRRFFLNAEGDRNEILQSMGFDGVRVGTMVVVFEPTQIKSVFNRGTFDPNDPNILRQNQRGSFNPSTSTITLLKDADLSTFLHETGHFYLELLGSIASDPNAPPQIRDDMNTILDWVGVESLDAWNTMSLDEQREAHEKFARGFEAYLFEGKSPSVELQSIFQRFRSWLVNIYRDLRNLDVELTDEVRRVFDRLVATEDAIQEMQTIREMQPLFTTAEEAGMTPDEWASYQSLGEEATNQAIEDLGTRSLRDMRWLSNAKSRELKRLQKDAKQKRNTIRNEAEVEVLSKPVHQAYNFITKGEYTIPDTANKSQRRLVTEAAVGEGSTKMSTASLKEFYGEENDLWRALPTGRYGLVSTKGIDFNAIADLFGYSSGDAMVQELLMREDPKAEIEALADRLMLERYGDLTDPTSIERAVDEAVHNDARTRFVATEMAALQKAIGGRKVLASAARDLAQTMINRLRIRDVKPSRYTAAEGKEARAADKARRSGDLEKAATHKRNQLIQLYAAKAALNAQNQIEKDLRYLKKFDREGSRKTIDVEYLDQIDAILERFDLRKSTSLRTIDKRKSLADWLQSQEEIGIQPDIPEEVRNAAYSQHYKNMSVEEMRGVVDTIKQIEHLGKLKNKLLTLKDKRQFNTVIEELVDSIEVNHKGPLKDNTTRATTGDRIKHLFKGYLAQHRKVASLARQMDGVKDGGQMWEVFIRTMNAAGDTEASMREQATVKLAEMSADIMKQGRMGGKGTYYPTLQRSLNREERLGIVLNMGNAGNMQRLLDGKGWTREQIQPVVDSLTKEETVFIQNVWNLFDSFRPQIAAKERRIYGKEPEWVEATPLETPHGTLEGGYYPIKYDTRQSAQSQQQDDAEVAKQQLHGAYTSATTRRSFTKTRADQVVERPLLLTMDAMYSGLNEVIHDLSWHEWLIDANRLLRSKRLTNAILETQGYQNLRQFKDAVRDIAAGEVPNNGGFEKATAHLRAGATVAGLGLSVSTALINTTGLAQSFVRVGPRWVTMGVSEWAANPTTLVSRIYEKSEFMRLRGKTMQREINEIQSLLRDKTKTRQAIDTLSFMPLVYTQVAVDTPTWWGAYQKALAEGNSEDRSVALADQAVIDAQGGGQVKDLAAIQRGGPLLKLWTTFYSYFSTTYQLTVEQTSKTNFKDPLDVIRLGGDYFMLYIIPAMLGTIIRSAVSGGDDFEDPEKLAKAYANEQISFAFGTMVGVREIASFAQKAIGVNNFYGGYSGPAGLRFFNELDRLGAQIGQGEIDTALRKSFVNVGGVWLRLPSSQINRTLDGITALLEGDTQNPAALVFGPPKER